MEQIEIQEIKHKTTKNVLFLSLRNIGIQSISTIGFILLTILLGTGDVGLFAVVAGLVGVLGYFSDVGLAAALIQKKDKIEKTELQTTFVIQQLLVIACLIVIRANCKTQNSLKVDTAQTTVITSNLGQN